MLWRPWPNYENMDGTANWKWNRRWHVRENNCVWTKEVPRKSEISSKAWYQSGDLQLIKSVQYNDPSYVYNCNWFPPAVASPNSNFSQPLRSPLVKEFDILHMHDLFIFYVTYNSIPCIFLGLTITRKNKTKQNKKQYNTEKTSNHYACLCSDSVI